MMSIKRTLLTLIVPVLFFSFIGSATAHTLWINSTDYTPPFRENIGAKTKIYMGWGHHFPVDSYVKASDFNKIQLFTPSGQEEALTLETTGFAAKQLKLQEKGLYVVTATRKEAYNTSFYENGKPKNIKGTKIGLNNIISSTHSQQFAKSLIKAGEGSSQNLSKVFGQKLELIPLTDPYTITNNRGGLMRVKVLFEGRPVQFNKVYAMYEGYSTGDAASCTVSTDRNGIAEIRIDHWGVWVIKTNLEQIPKGDMAKKVNKEKFYSSLTFSVL